MSYKRALPIGIILAQFKHQFGSKMVHIALTVSHCHCCPLPTPICIPLSKQGLMP
jgi:hypothetical protein